MIYFPESNEFRQRFVCKPDDYKHNSDIKPSMLDHIPHQSQETLIALQENGINPSHLLSLYHLLINTIHFGEHNPLSSTLAIAQTMGRVAEIHHAHLHHFRDLIDRAYESLHNMATATTHEMRQDAHTIYQDIRTKLTGSFQHEFSRFIGRFHHFFQDDGWKSIRLHRKVGWEISHEIIAKDLTRAALFTKQIAHGLFVIDISGTLIEAGEAIIQRDHWFDKLTQIGLNVETFFAASILVDLGLACLSLTPAGWAIIIIAGVATLGVQHATMQYAVNPYLSYIDTHYG